MSETPPPIVPADNSDYKHVHYRCHKCKLLVGEDGYCPDCHLKRVIYWSIGVFGATLLVMKVLLTIGGLASTTMLDSFFFGSLAACVCFCGAGLLTYHRRKRANERAFPEVAKARQLEKATRTAVRMYEIVSPPVVLGKKLCAHCSMPLDDTGWCYTCAKKRQSRIMMMFAVVPVVGFGACMVGVGGFYPHPTQWMQALQIIGSVLFGVGCLLVLLQGILGSIKIDRRRNRG